MTLMNTTSRSYLTTGFALFVCLGIIATFTPEAWGHGAGGDIALFSTGNQVDVGFAILDPNDDVQLVFDPDEDVFVNVLLPITPVPGFVPWQFASDEPGFDADEGEFTPGAEISFNMQELWYWDPNASASVLLSPASSSLSSGVAPQGESAFASGGFHDHPFYGVASDSGLPANGIYVGKLTVSVDELDDSDPYYMVSVITDVVTGISDPNARVTAAEDIGEMVRLYADDPGSNPVPIYAGTDFTFFADAVNHVRALAAIPEPNTVAILSVLLLSTGGMRLGRRQI